ncbi:hypothetical protein NM688_g5000 [Phlebia brevispora]|uniref:Uncharacterized protein n=1 Tax=Phlebia brevispora TaxID=194682 RepID=A0ACC1T1I1_9APHY|nr:hypothetical protein NM688_g5000 [Phlebia brevispora]
MPPVDKFKSWEYTPPPVKFTLFAQLVLAVILGTLYFVAEFGTKLSALRYQIDVQTFLHAMILFTLLLILVILRLPEQRDPEWEIPETLLWLSLPLQVAISCLFVSNSVSLGLYIAYLVTLKGANAFPEPHTLDNAGVTYSVLLLTILTWLLTASLLLAVWAPDFYDASTCVARQPGSHAPKDKSGGFGKKIEAGWLKRPLPVKIVDIKKNPDPRLFDKSLHEKGQVQWWDQLSQAEAAQYTARPHANPFEDPRFETVSLD